MAYTTKSVAVYRRVSSVQQNAELQATSTSDYCLAKSIKADTVEVFTDNISGVATSRPAFDKMMEGVKTGRIKKVIVWRLDRLGRSSSHLMQCLDLFRKMKCEFVSVKEGMDTSESTGRLLYGIVACMAEFERNLISERMMMWAEDRRAKGLPFGRKLGSKDKKKRKRSGYIERHKRLREQAEKDLHSLHGEDAGSEVLRMRIKDLQKQLKVKESGQSTLSLPIKAKLQPSEEAC